MNSIETISLSKSFGDVTAVNDVSFAVDEGEIFGFLGPNGAGKSTTMMILTTLLNPTSGKALVAGYDVMTHAKKVRENIGYVQQDSTVDEFLTGRENLFLQARLNRIPKSISEKRIDDILALIELTEKQDDAVVTYSGGMRKRLDIAGGLLHMPKVLFLDEPTVGLDIQTRRKIWQYIKQIHIEYGMSIFLSTHYMEEADNLCDRVGIIDYGKIQIIDSPTSMKNSLGNEVITFSLFDTENQTLIPKLKEISFVKDVKLKEEKITVFTSNGTEVIPKIFQISSEHGIKIKTISLTQPSLDDVFINYTGHQLRDENGTSIRKKGYKRMTRFNS
ncbi:ABC transporter ATP-binding protein [Nitrosopumilus sp. b1]|uniref:ATP-binding cassette domain-containing protein n=1 Tax=Nitrosopumilus sp. b1 TaxID=2109907 RepID=UPI0015F65163|nr:ATP-binding cassette domain-containing protein [Nitrosopumilus sp. b1]KAF6243234.1 ABC transporter ATP-binding protein [Nitrosopumilus sp. b1]